MSSCSLKLPSPTRNPRLKPSRSCWKKMDSGSPPVISSSDLNSQNLKTTKDKHESYDPAGIDLFGDNPPGNLGWSLEADRHVEERAQRPTGMVYMPRHLQHHRHSAHPLHPVFPENRDANTDKIVVVWKRNSPPGWQGTQPHQRRTPAAKLRMIEREGHDCRVFGENRVHRAPQVANAFAVNDSHLQNAPFLTRGQVIRDEVSYLARIERVQIQHAVNWQFNRLVIHESQLLFCPCPRRHDVTSSSCDLSGNGRRAVGQPQGCGVKPVRVRTA